MVSLCGLALSSLFVINSKSVVHADAVNDANNQNNNAISWDSDSDKAQQVQNDSEQSPVQKVDDDQQNQVLNTNSRAETSNARSSSAVRSLTNQTKSIQVSNVNDVQKTSPIVIDNPAGDKVNVHYVNRDGGAISDPNVKDTTIDVTKTGQGSYQVPSGYNLNNPDGKYTISGGAFNGTNLKGNTWTVPAQYQTKNVLSTGDYAADEFLRNHNSLQKDYALEVGHTAGDNDNEDYSSDLHPSATVDIYSDYHDMYSGSSDNSWIKKDNVSWYYNSSSNGIEPASSSDAALCERLSNEVSLKGLDLYYWTVDYRDMKVQTTPAYTMQQLPVAFVDQNNNIVGMIQNYSGKVGTTQNVSLTVPTGYKLANGETLPTSMTFANNTNAKFIKVVSNGQTNSVQNPANNTINVNFVDQKTHKSVGTAAIDLTKQQQGTNYYQTPNGWATDNNGRYDVGTPFSRGYLTITDDKGNNAQQLMLNAKQAQDFFEAFRKGHDTDLSIQAHLPASHPDEINLADLAYNGVSTYDKENGDRSWENIVYNATKKVIQTETNRHMTDNYGQGVFDGYYGKITAKRYNAYTFTDNYHTISNGTVTVPVHKTNSFSFADNSGNVKSVSGNTVDVTLTKPQSVNPAMDKRCQSQATRTIQINFPDGQIPEAYDGIVDKSGKLVQTVHFTRTATEDALTGNILQYGNWTSDNQDRNFIGFPERTLPRIPGYTLSIKPF